MGDELRQQIHRYGFVDQWYILGLYDENSNELLYYEPSLLDRQLELEWVFYFELVNELLALCQSGCRCANPYKMTSSDAWNVSLVWIAHLSHSNARISKVSLPGKSLK